MKNISLLCLSLFMFASPLWADIAADGSLTTNSDTKNVSVTIWGNTVTSGTALATRDPYVTRTYIVPRSTWTTLYVSTLSTVSPSNGFAIPGNILFSPDGPMVPWWGPLFGVISGTGTLPQNGIDNAVSVFRSK